MFHEAFAAEYAALPGWVLTLVRISVVIILGYFAIGIVRTVVLKRGLARARVDPTVGKFVSKLVTASGYTVLGVIILTMLGVDLGALIGGLAIGGFVIGFALKDSLGNLAAGFVLLMYRPFAVGDLITIGSHTGKVVELGVALTTMTLLDGQQVTIPNGNVLGGAIINFSRNPTRRINIPVGIGYSDDIDAATRALLELVTTERRALAEPAPAVIVTNLGESSVDLELRVWVRTEDFGGVSGMLRRDVKKAIENAGCSIPFPQREILMRAPQA